MTVDMDNYFEKFLKGVHYCECYILVQIHLKPIKNMMKFNEDLIGFDKEL